MNAISSLATRPVARPDCSTTNVRQQAAWSSGNHGVIGTMTERAALFGPFRLLPAQQLLLESENPIRLGSRALEILIALVERAGELVTKGELMARVWPNSMVEEDNLKVHISTLRRILGDGQSGRRYLVTVPGRGYCFVAPVEFSTPEAAG